MKCEHLKAWNGASLYHYVGTHMGYRFHISSVHAYILNDMLQISVKIQNTGFSPLYQNAMLRLIVEGRGRTVFAPDSPCDLRQCRPGTGGLTIRASLPLTEGKVYLQAVRVWDDRQIHFANPSDAEGRVLLLEARL